MIRQRHARDNDVTNCSLMRLNRQCPQMMEGYHETVPSAIVIGPDVSGALTVPLKLAPPISAFLLSWTRRETPLRLCSISHIRPGRAGNHRVRLAAMAGGDGAARWRN